MKEKLRAIPKMDTLLGFFEKPSPLHKEVLQAVLEKKRAILLSGGDCDLGLEVIVEEAMEQISSLMDHHLRPLVNGTGIPLHTNLGRAPLSEAAAMAVYKLVKTYNNLEFDLATGKRGSRYSHVVDKLCTLTGAEDAIVVNNNAAAVMLVLNTLAKDKEVIVSRGELVEIGGSFRIPAVMEMSGARLKEVGTTNKTHLHDYEGALTEDTGLILKVHTSNYRVMGFTEAVAIEDLRPLSQEAKLPLVEDLGSGSFLRLNREDLSEEPTVMEQLAKGVDIITFSGDKLLGGPQAGIILGKKEYIEQMRKNQLTRALRVGKMTIAALEATLIHYLKEEALTALPVLAALKASDEDIKAKCQFLLQEKKVPGELVVSRGQVGGGAMPLDELSSYAIRVTPKTMSAKTLYDRLKNLEVPIIGRIEHEAYYLDPRMISQEELSYVGDMLCKEVGEG